MKSKATQFKTGVFFGKMIPPTLGHVNQIIEAAAQCDKLYVIVSENKTQTIELSKEAGVQPIWGSLRVQWLAQTFQDISHIEVKMVDETNIPPYPNGWVQWSNLISSAVGNASIDAFFCGEPEYKAPLETYFRNCTVCVFDYNRTQVDISATRVRADVMAHWDYLIGPARPHFAKKILLVGTSSCGKTTLTKSLAKLFNTSWSEEVGRFYAQKYLGGSEEYFVASDFQRIAHLQYEQDFQALRSCNKMCFFDTDATTTQYYSEMYLGEKNKIVEAYIDKDRYDLVLFLWPTVPFVEDGQRMPEDEVQRVSNANKLLKMYTEQGFGDKLFVIRGADYLSRLHTAKGIIQASYLNKEVKHEETD